MPDSFFLQELPVRAIRVDTPDSPDALMGVVTVSFVDALHFMTRCHSLFLSNEGQPGCWPLTKEGENA
jgi:hypothetical protein